MDVLRPYLSRIIAPVITFILAILTRKLGIIFPENASADLTGATVTIIIPFLLAINGVIHKILDKWFNPSDAATPALAAEGKDVQKAVAARNAAKRPPR